MTGDVRFKGRFARVLDVAIADLHSASAVRTEGTPGGDHDLVVMHAVRRGTLTVGGQHEHTVSARQFLLGRFGRELPFESPPHTEVKIVFLPAAMLTPLLGDRIITGPADSAEARLLAAHADMVQATVADLGPAGVHAAHSTLIELAKAVVIRRFDDKEPLLAPALAQTARDLANRHLVDPELSLVVPPSGCHPRHGCRARVGRPSP
ncbi:hypothetical protein [Streptomyces cellulosae]|uniref:AraC-type transcription regulator ligand-binding domain-containing protein n=1 Tax=Streptomyces cellulosae TaxID=1968 RepID=A0ABW7YGK0_STRCE